MSGFVRNPNLAIELEAQIRPALRAAGEVVATKADQLAHSAMPRRGHKRMEVSETAVGVRVANTNFGAHLEEWGGAGVHSPIYAPLRRGARAAGLKLHES